MTPPRASYAPQTAPNRIDHVSYSEAFTAGVGTVDLPTRSAKFACDSADVAQCVWTPGALTSDADYGTRWGTGCGGDSGGAWLMDKGAGSSPRY